MPSSSWVRMNESESDWISLKSLCKMAESKMAEFKMAAIIKSWSDWISMSQSQSGVGVFEWIWEKITRCLNPMACESNMAEFKMAAIIKLSQNEWVKFFYVEMVVTNLGKCEWVWEDKLRRLNPRWQIQDRRIQEAAIIKLSENEWVWGRLN